MKTKKNYFERSEIEVVSGYPTHVGYLSSPYPWLITDNWPLGTAYPVETLYWQKKP